jgi:hypothetical protein
VLIGGNVLVLLNESDIEKTGVYKISNLIMGEIGNYKISIKFGGILFKVKTAISDSI